LATAQGLREQTLTDLLELSDKWKERIKVYEQLPELLDEPERVLALTDQLRRRTTNGNDLYFLDQTIRAVISRWPDSQPLADQLRARFWAHMPAPPRELFQWVDTPQAGRAHLWRQIPAGTFLMGSPEGEGFDDEHPRHKVVVDEAFRFCAVPVTNAQYRAFDPGYKPRVWEGVPPDELDHHPVVEVTWYEAMAFCQWLAATLPAARGARLPTEEEWEYACRAGTETRYWSGDDKADLAKVGWYDRNSEGRTHRVGEKPANPWGLYDVHGNVWEWTLNTFSDDYSGRERGVTVESSSVDPADYADSSGAGRVFRGGGCWGTAVWARAAFRNLGGPGFVVGGRGFRVVLPGAPEP
jgi:formylglycine-generating enzyme required for sulfatase activity